MSGGRKTNRMTIADVAGHAGVSVMTVSRVINRDSKVKPATRTSVERSIKTLGYSPNVAARTLAGGKVRRIGLLYGNPSSAYLGDLLVGALEAASDVGAQLVVERTDASFNAANFSRRIEHDWDGLIVPPPMSDSLTLRQLVRDRGLPTVFLASALDTTQSFDIRIDDHQAAFEMTDMLIAKGHKRIGFIEGHPNQTVSAARRSGFEEALDAAGLDIDTALIEQGRFSYRSGQEATARLLDLESRPTAIFASNDDMAAGCLAGAASAGVCVPNELAVAGFDDSSIATVVWPPLSTLRQPVAEMAAMAVNALVDAGRDGLVATTRVVEHAVIRRGSTGD